MLCDREVSAAAPRPRALPEAPGQNAELETKGPRAVSTDNDLAIDWEEPAAALRRAYLRAGDGDGRRGARSRQAAWQRHDVVRAIYSIAKGEDGVVVDLHDLLSATDLPQGQVYNALDHLEQDGVLRTFNGNCVMLLQKGIDAYEQAATKPYRMIVQNTPGVRPGLSATAPTGAGRSNG
jgi:hypothetical protein